MQTYFILDELLINGYNSESSKGLVNKELQIQKDIFDEKEEKEKKSKKWWKFFVLIRCLNIRLNHILLYLIVS